MRTTFLILLFLVAAPVAAGNASHSAYVQTSQTDCAVFAAVLKEFYAEAKAAGKNFGYVSLMYVVSDRTHALSTRFDQLATNEYFGSADEVRSLLRMPIAADLKLRARGRSAVTCPALPSGFRLAPDRRLPVDILFENRLFERRFSPAEGVIYLTLPGYSNSYTEALIVSEMYFSIWETSALYALERRAEGWRVVSKRLLHEQGE